MHIIRSETLGRRLASAKSLAKSLAETLSETLVETFGETLGETFRARHDWQYSPLEAALSKFCPFYPDGKSFVSTFIWI